jgi:predicted Rossmann fold flavoprotein
MGVELKLEETGKYFPVTDDADTVLEALLSAARAAGVEIQAGARVVRLERTETGYRLGIQAVKSASAFGGGAVSRRGEEHWPLPGAEPDRWVEAECSVIATGGLSFPRTGSDGAGYGLMEALGHTIEPPVPALTPLTAADPLCRAAQGVTLDVELSLWVGGKRVEKIRGSMVIAHFGYSGPAALDLSRHFLRAAGERRVTASFVPGETVESFTRAWVDAATKAPERTARRHLSRWLPERLAERLCEEVRVDPGVRVGQVPRERRTVLVDRVLARDLGVDGTLGYEKAEVTAGGVQLSEVDPSTLQSRVSPGLFLCGEILDVEGRLGGFNFQWAWSSGTVAGRAASS